MTKYLVTGGAGFIGSNLVRRLNQDKDNQIYIIIESGTNLWRVENICSDLNFAEINLTDFDKITDFIKKIKPEIIFHLASFGGLPDQKAHKIIYDVNFYGTVNLLNACKTVGFKAFINTGSSSEYGIKEIEMKEDDLLSPVSDYGVSKAAATQFCLKEALFNKLPVYTIRPFSVYGDYEMKGRLIPTIVSNFLLNKPIPLSGKDFVRDFIYVHDFVDCCIKISEICPKDYYIFNSGTAVQTSIGQLLEIFSNIYNKNIDVKWGKIIPRPWEPKNWKANIERAKNILNWEPKYNLKSGLMSTIAWFENNLDFYK